MNERRAEMAAPALVGYHLDHRAHLGERQQSIYPRGRPRQREPAAVAHDGIEGPNGLAKAHASIDSTRLRPSTTARNPPRIASSMLVRRAVALSAGESTASAPFSSSRAVSPMVLRLIRIESSFMTLDRRRLPEAANRVRLDVEALELVHELANDHQISNSRREVEEPGLPPIARSDKSPPMIALSPALSRYDTTPRLRRTFLVQPSERSEPVPKCSVRTARPELAFEDEYNDAFDLLLRDLHARLLS